mmetsp:Transcript_17599/g.52878  ORF Transcript_17599/g.52878 Transcript_17599/m.52878 type:complete len:742 (+) Transcript_17599:405-2630(+)
MAAQTYSTRVVGLPNKTLGYSNKVYVAPSDWLAQCGISYVEISSCVLSVEVFRGVEPLQPQTIALNALQRKWLRLSTDDVVQVTPFRPPSQSFAATLLVVEISRVSKRAASTPLDLEASDLTMHLTTRMDGMVFHTGQEVAFEYQGQSLLLTVRSMLVHDLMSSTQESVDRAMMTSETACTFDAIAASGIKITGQKNSIAAPQLFKNKEFNFESLGIGGLDAQFEQIFRRAFASRVFPPDMVERLGIRHVKGVLLYGPPGTGKTLIARQIGKMLNGKEPKVVNGPEILNKFVGESEANMRKLFEDAEKDERELGPGSELHVIIFDEIDAICKARGSVQSGGGVHDTLVNQLLTKIDGVDSLNNILLIGMTNRKDMLDEALLRPGRLEVHVEIGLPDDKGRLQILKIHTNKMLENSFLGRDIDLWDLAVRTKNFSGAEIEGLVKAAVSYALNRQVDVSDLSKPIDEENIKVMMEDFNLALEDVKPAFGAIVETLETYRLNGIIDYGNSFRHLLSSCQSIVQQVRSSDKTPLLTCLLEGPGGAGKTALAASMGIDSDYPFVKVVSAQNYVGYTEAAKCQAIAKVFDDAYKSPLSIIVLDDIERLLEFVAIGPRFSNSILQTLLVLLKKAPPVGRKLLVIGTTSMKEVMEDMGVAVTFDNLLHVPLLQENEVAEVLKSQRAFFPNELDMAIEVIKTAQQAEFAAQLPIKRLLQRLEMARSSADLGDGQEIPLERWKQVIQDMGI